MDKNEYRERRKAMGLTQRQLADLLGLTRDTIIAREAGRRRLVKEHFLALERLSQSVHVGKPATVKIKGATVSHTAS